MDGIDGNQSSNLQELIFFNGLMSFKTQSYCIE